MAANSGGGVAVVRGAGTGRAAGDAGDREAGIAGLACSAKLDVAAPPRNVVPLGSVSVSRVPSRFASVSGDGLDDSAASSSFTVTDRLEIGSESA